jgi:hypothetical protein
MVLAEEGPKGGILIARPMVDALIAAIRAAEIDVLVIDPFVTTHRVSENDNRSINAVASLWREVADRAGCAVELVHHAVKAARLNGEELGIGQARGAGALIDAARSARFIVGMTKEDAANAGLPSHHGFFRVETGKANLAPPADRATWRRLVSVPLGNGAGLWPDGDHVAVATAWNWPDAFAGVTSADLGRVQSAIRAGTWKASEKADDWAGNAVAEVLGLDIGPYATKGRSFAHHAARARVRSLIGTWIANRALIEVRRRDPATRRETPFIEAAIDAG